MCIDHNEIIILQRMRKYMVITMYVVKLVDKMTKTDLNKIIMRNF